MFHPNSSNAFYKAAVSPRAAMGTINRALKGLGARGGVNTPKRLMTEVDAMMKARPRVFNAAFPEYAGNQQALRKKIMQEMVPDVSAKATQGHKKIIQGLQEGRRQVLPGGNPNTAYRPYAPGASPNLTRQVMREGGTQVPRMRPKPQPKQAPLSAAERGQFVAPSLTGPTPGRGATVKAVSAPAAPPPKAAPSGATARAVGRQTAPPTPYTKQQKFTPGEKPAPRSTAIPDTPATAVDAAAAATPEIAAAQADAANVGAITEPAEQGLWDQAKGMFMTPEGKIDKVRAGLGIGAGALGGYGLYNAMKPEPSYQEQVMQPQYRGY